jgi:sugar/nucleoside kinase (ribokinase family)
MKVLAMTVCCVDIYQNTGRVYVGGNSLNFATQCVQMGVAGVAVLGAVGNDPYGVLIRQYIKEKGIDDSHLYVQSGRTASNKIHIDPGGDRYFMPDSWDGGAYQTFRLAERDWDFAKCYDLVALPCGDPNFAEVLARKRNHFKLVVDFLDTRDFDLIIRSLPQIDLGFISGDREVADWMRASSLRTDAVLVVTLGAEGSRAFYRGKEYFQPAIPVAKVIDTTGCGDAYQAAFTVSYLANRGIVAAMEQGATAAARVLSHFGGVE